MDRFWKVILVLATIASIIQVLPYLTGKQHLKEYKWMRYFPAWLPVLVLIVAAFFIAKYNDPAPAPAVVVIPPADSGNTVPPPVPKKKTYNGVIIAVRLNKEQHDDFSEALAAVYREKMKNVLVGDYPHLAATTSITGDIVVNPSENDPSSYIIKLVLKTYQGNGTLCSTWSSNETIPLVEGDSKDKIIRQGFGDILYKLRSGNQLPLCH